MYRLAKASISEGVRRQDEEAKNPGVGGMTEKPIEITMVASEMFPFAKSGGLGDVIGALPPALERMGHKVCVYLPAYRSILRKYEPGSPTQVADVFSDDRYEVFSLEHEGVSVKLVAADELFDRNGFYGDAAGRFPTTRSVSRVSPGARSPAWSGKGRIRPSSIVMTGKAP